MNSFFRFIIVTVLMLLCFPNQPVAQTGNLNQLQQRLKLLEQKTNHQTDTAYLNTKNSIAFIYADRYPDTALLMLPQILDACKSADYREGVADAIKIMGNAYQTKGDFEMALKYYEEAEILAQKIKYRKALPGILGNIGLVYMNQGNYPAALQKFYASLQAAEAMGDKLVVRSNLNNIGTLHFYQGKMTDAENAFRKTLQISEAIADTDNIILAYNNIGEVNLEQNNPRKALQHLTIAYWLAGLKHVPQMLAAVSNTMGDCYLKLDSTQQAIVYFNRALQVATDQSNARAVCKAQIGLAKVKNKLGLYSEALAHGNQALLIAREMGQAQLLRDAYEIIAAVYENMGDGINAVTNYRQFRVYADSLQNLENERAAANYKAEYAFSKKELEFERRAFQQRWILYSTLAALLVLSIFLWVIYRNKKRLNKNNIDLQLKNELVKAEKLKAEKALLMLKATQSQLIQSEKMASLGELTAGIAHEIQNPLNFVNNFSELNSELIDELVQEIDAGNIEESKALAADIKENEKKINQHGNRADAIVKGMLQHSRRSNGAKESTDINVLADEYLRLAYHGLRAKDKTFNAELKTDFDTSLQKLNIIPQDLGRVILNLITNAFYVVNEKTRLGIQGYQPTVTVSTKRTGQHVELKVSDNGNGIPQHVLEKIFQPFFTTKPAGQGTGLGLSLSYDIVKAHGGELLVDTVEGQGTTFTIKLNA